MLIAFTACTAPANEDRRAAESADLGTRVSEYLEQRDEYEKVRAVLVYEDGERVLELYRGEGAKDYLNLRSVTKSVVSTLIGIAIDEGLITGVDATLGELLPAYRDEMNAEVAAIPLDRILTHTAGFAAGGSGTDVGQLDYYSTPDWIGAIIADRVTRGPGDGSFEYSNAGSHVLAAILDEATDGSILDFAERSCSTHSGSTPNPPGLRWTRAPPRNSRRSPRSTSQRASHGRRIRKASMRVKVP